MWDWAETKWTDFGLVSFVFYLEGQVFVVSWVNWNVMISVRQVNTGSLHNLGTELLIDNGVSMTNFLSVSNLLFFCEVYDSPVSDWFRLEEQATENNRSVWWHLCD